MLDAKGNPLVEGTIAKLSGSYGGFPAYLAHERVEVASLGRTKVRARLTDPSYAGRVLTVDPKALVAVKED